MGDVAVEHRRRHRGYGGFGVEGQAFGTGSPLAWCTTCATENTVTPHASAIALPVLPAAAYANLALRRRYPGIYTSDGGFYDAVNPVTGQIGHRRLVLDQSMIMAALDDALDHGALQKHFAADPESYAARLYLSDERANCRVPILGGNRPRLLGRPARSLDNRRNRGSPRRGLFRNV